MAADFLPATPNESEVNMEMTNVHTRIEQSSDRLVKGGLKLKDILADGRIDDGEICDLRELADELLLEAVEVEDVALDIVAAKQTLTIGRKNSPNRSLRDRDQRIELLKSLHDEWARGQRKTPTNREAVGVNGHNVFESNRK
jgi:hypothetical protein